MKTQITAEEFDRRFEAGEDISEFVDWKSARRPGLESQRVNVDFPAWMVAAMDMEAARLGVSRQALIKFVINGHLLNDFEFTKRGTRTGGLLREELHDKAGDDGD